MKKTPMAIAMISSGYGIALAIGKPIDRFEPKYQQVPKIIA